MANEEEVYICFLNFGYVSDIVNHPWSVTIIYVIAEDAAFPYGVLQVFVIMSRYGKRSLSQSVAVAPYYTCGQDIFGR